jgi:hypothetical protein
MRVESWDLRASRAAGERSGAALALQDGGSRSLTVGVVDERPVDVEPDLFLVAVTGQLLPPV